MPSISAFPTFSVEAWARCPAENYISQSPLLLGAPFVCDLANDVEAEVVGRISEEVPQKEETSPLSPFLISSCHSWVSSSPQTMMGPAR